LISIGNGETARFWDDRWLNKKAPKQMAPLCYKLAARKLLTVKEALANGRWMRGLRRMDNEEQLDQFLELWAELQNVSLSNETDGITWCVSADGKYSAKSAYDVQFHGRIKQPHLEHVWRIKAEGNVKFFLWLNLQNRNWTAERRRAHGLPHEDKCSLCDQEFETAAHLALNCSFSKQVWALFQGDSPRAFLVASRSQTLAAWWKKLRHGRKDDRHKRDISLSVYIIWHIWKERGRRLFQKVSMPPLAVVGLIRADMDLLQLATANTASRPTL
jgi:hypothetical protein